MSEETDLSHLFIFSPGTWLGEGKIRLNSVKEELGFATRWTIKKEKKLQIDSVQEIEIKGLPEFVKNQFYFYNIKPNRFKIRLENQDLGEVVGDGIIKQKLIAWEFRLPELGFEGFEVYDLQEDDSYFMHAEYSTSEDFRTKIQGKIWKKALSK